MPVVPAGHARSGRKSRAPQAALPTVGSARHLGRLSWDDPPLIEHPVLPFARSTSHPSESPPAGEPLFGFVSPVARLDAPEGFGCRHLPGCPVWHVHLRRLEASGVAALACGSPRPPALLPTTPAFLDDRCLHRPPELWSSPDSSFRSDPDRARPRGLRRFVLPRWASSSCEPV